MTVKGVSIRHLWCFWVFLLISDAFDLSVQGPSIALNLPSSLFRPHPDEAAAFARWLVSRSSWGVLNTIASDLGGAPFGNVVSFSDGDPDKSSGIPYFYLTTLDPTASYALKDQRSSFTISEYPLGTCGSKDPENPSCAKITLVGKLKLLDGNSKEADFARNALFTKHPEMKGWPKNHHFQFFGLEIDDIFLINWFGGPKPLTVEQYLQIDMNEVSHSA
ncbi:OLC1v1011233C1 [Oldenlandia corymbosa var. corymbosa]|uniref:OLC1v1011233C1 n=1 Tax=Oldenlandia corymbosa var. corymbosa TaxID=529605 RepID=A0AAV1DT89_OLDCO|nr:OLC1v1011233C1 [Oldenlandia corymbosa var. corymbosa]